MITKVRARRGIALAAMTAAGALVLSGIAVADEVSNTVDNSVDATVESLSVSAGTSRTTQFYVDPANDDGKQGCNIQGGESFSVAVSSSDATVASVSPTSLTFTACGAAGAQTVTVTAHKQGTARISLAQTGNTTGATFTLAEATFDVTASGATNTPPQVAVTGVTDGSTYRLGSVPVPVPVPGCSVVDTEDTNESATPQVSNGPYDSLGAHTVTCSYTDGGGETRSATATYTVLRALDTTAPVISYDLTPVDGQNGWHRGDVSLAWSVIEAESPETLTTTGCVNQSITSDQTATTYTCSASSEGGNAEQVSVTIQRDGTPPEVAYGGFVSGTAGTNGWYTSDVTVSFTATDTGSGLAAAAQNATSTGEGHAMIVPSPVFTDRAGNASNAGAASSHGFKIDKSDPTTPTFNNVPSDFYFGQAPTVAPTCDSSDEISGLAGCAVTGFSNAVGTHTLVATATDNAGRTSTSTASYTVKAWTMSGFYAPVDMGTLANPVYNTVKGGSTVPLKFELFAGSTELTNTSDVKSFTSNKVNCTSGAEDAVETLATTGGTSLRYDTTGGQFIQNWKTPTGAGTCYRATMTAADGSTISALFKIK